MMHEALPPNHSTLPFDPDAFRSPVDMLPPKLQVRRRVQSSQGRMEALPGCAGCGGCRFNS